MRVLIAEDDSVSRRLLEATLKKWGYEVTVCINGAEAAEALKAAEVPQLAILDWMMPEMDGVQVCREVRRHEKETHAYILLLTAKNQKEDLFEGMSAGADDYLTKPFDPKELGVRLRAGRRIIELQTRLLAACERLRRQATHDPLTGLWNHSAILDILQRELSRSKREGAPLSILMLDIDYFKRINDTRGHAVGDVVLRDIARRAAESVRDYDAFGRYGGDEFLAVLPGADGDDAVHLAERFCTSVAEMPVHVPEGVLSVTMSIGVATNARHPDLERNVLIRAADAALYKAKNAGRNRAWLADTDDIHAHLPADTALDGPAG